MSHEQPVWYAAYGSNMDRERLRTYLAGGRPRGGQRGYAGARDTSMPTAAVALERPGRLWFANRSTVWHGGGVAFVAPAPSASPFSAPRLHCRAFRITLGQLEDIAMQESHAATRPRIDLELLAEVGQQTIADTWYGRVVSLGTHDDVPVLTVTGVHDVPTSVNPPSRPYVATIARGLAAARGFDAEAVADYLGQWPGADAIELERLRAWCQKALDIGSESA